MSDGGGVRPGAPAPTPANSTIRVDPSVTRADTLAVAAQHIADRVGPTSPARIATAPFGVIVSAAILWVSPKAIPRELVHTTACFVTYPMTYPQIVDVQLFSCLM